MTISAWLICALWLALVGYWGLSARAVKQSTGTRWIWWREIAVRLGFFALAVQLLQRAVAANALPDTRLHAPDASWPMGLAGVLLCALGIGLAILGRRHLTRTWGVPMAGKENPELVTTGPYAMVRHPIYGGMLLAMVGSAIGQSVLWLLPLIVYGPNFIRSARREEKLLVERFPDRYPAYMKRTRMLLPFVL